MFHRTGPLFRLALVAGAIATAAATLDLAAQSPQKAGLFDHLRWRAIGPYRGGRVTTVAGVADNPLVYYMGATGGGVWKTNDGGLHWHPVSDGSFKTGSVGAIAVAPSDPNLVYVGMGEVCIRSDASHGDGVYKSEDAGRTWKHVGLPDSRHVGQIRIHPANPDLVYVAVLGHIFGPSEERGIFRSEDGGKTWTRILFVNDETGFVDLALDVTNPRILFAAAWQVRRTPWGIYSVNPGGGLYRSTDGGDTWSELTAGLPDGPKGRIGVTVSPVSPSRVWAVIEADGGGVFRSDDGGSTWRQMTDDFNVVRRAYYYAHILADTQDADTVYVLTSPFLKSIDGGRTFTEVQVPHGDNHALWIAPGDNRRMVNGNDGGANVSFNAGESWTAQNNQATAQFYHVTTDSQFPYRIYGSQQDNTTVSIPHRTDGGGIDVTDWYPVGGGESGYLAVHPTKPNVVFGGSYYGRLTRYDHDTGEVRDISVWPVSPAGRVAAELPYRFQWTFPIFVSVHEPHALYAAANVLFRSLDEGHSWKPISGDLTRDDKSKQQDERLTDYYDTIFAAAESPLQKGLIWAGTDDGLVHLTRDDGKSWQNVTPAAMQPWTRVSLIEPSAFDPGTAYVAANRYQLDDYRPYLYRTTDYGQTWSLIVAGIGKEHFVRVVREDPARRGLLFAGTETGVYVSFDAGARWESLQLNLPAVPVHDLAVKNGDVVAGTHGRSFWVLDDMSAIEQWRADIASNRSHLFEPRPTYRIRTARRRTSSPALGENPPPGVLVHYYLSARPEKLTLEFLDGSGNVITSFASGDAEGDRRSLMRRVPVDPGINRFEWDMRYPDAVGLRGATELFGGSLRGPLAVPGPYAVRLTVDGRSSEQPFEIRPDLRLDTTTEEYRDHFDLLIRIRDLLSETHTVINRILGLREQVQALIDRARHFDGGEAVLEAARTLERRLDTIQNELVELRFTGIDDQMLVFPLKLNVHIASLQGAVAAADATPTAQAYEAFEELERRLRAQTMAFEAIVETELTRLNRLAADRALPAVVVPDPSRSRR